MYSWGSALCSHKSCSTFSHLNLKLRVFFFFWHKRLIFAWHEAIQYSRQIQTSGLLATVDGCFHLHDRITKFFQRQRFSIFFFNSISLSNDLRYCLVLLYRPCGLSSHSSFHYFLFHAALWCVLIPVSQPEVSLRVSFLGVCKSWSSLPSPIRPNESAKQISEAVVNSYHRTSVILVTTVHLCGHRKVRCKCGSQMSLHKCSQNKSLFV